MTWRLQYLIHIQRCFVEGKKAQVCGHINIVVMGQGPSSDRGNGIDLHQQG